MPRPSPNRPVATGFFIALLALSATPAQAERVYRCVEGGKTLFTSDIKDKAGCVALDLNVPQPNPVDVARQEELNRQHRQMEKKQRADEDAELRRKAQANELAKSVAAAPVPTPPGFGRRGGKRSYR